MHYRLVLKYTYYYAFTHDFYVLFTRLVHLSLARPAPAIYSFLRRMITPTPSFRSYRTHCNLLIP